MKKFQRATVIFLTLLSCFLFVPVALAHPLGNFTVNQYAGLHISREKLTIDYVMDLAEIPAFQEIELLDTNGNRLPDAAETQGYHAVRCAGLQPSLNLSINGKATPISLVSSSVEFPPGVGGLPTMRLTCAFEAPISSTQQTFALSFQNNVWADRLGWQEIVVIPDGVDIQGEYSSTSISQRLTAYPEDLLNSPLEQRSVDMEVTMFGIAPHNPSTVPAAVGETSSLSDRNDPFTRLILLEELTLPALLLALGVAFVWGAAHALTPGHGKTIVGAYLVGSRGTMKHAVYLGLTTTITHTLGVFALGLITLFAAQYIVPETLYPWMTLLSGLFVVGIGVNLFLERYRSAGLREWVYRLRRKPQPQQNYVFSNVTVGPVEGSNHKSRNLSYVLSPSQAGLHAHGHEHPHHSHDHDHDHSHDHEHNHPHDHGHLHEHDHHEHPHPHEHDHVHDDNDHHDHSHDHTHDHDHGGHHHHHGPGGHSHMPPEEITWRSLWALGVSGGLVPCPSALIVLLGAIALNKIGFGLILVLAFSLGLAATLTAIGMLFIYAGRLFERFPSHGRVIKILPVLSALFISMVGAAIVWKALGEMGIV